MTRYRPVSKEVVWIVFTLQNSDKRSVSRIDARFGKFKQWAAHVLAAYSEESLSLKVVALVWTEKENVPINHSRCLSRYFETTPLTAN